ncbi:Tox-REase-5 domain-containing protein [Aquimarina megaterium]|uniref:Tox-REase-5 domain-containing protein n=1 Tax=Aquimarina megaterium TaxID=1443666 RepID=UPI0009F43A55|nr:Tox-REase-5 domain-containing protein [Aquimarina megaterium]
MKSIYKMLILGIVCLLSTSAFSQFEITPDAKNIGSFTRTGTAFDCTCYYEGDSDRLAAILNGIANAERQKWLEAQQAIQKKEIENRMGTTYPSFAEAQKAFFKEKIFAGAAKDRIRDLRQRFKTEQNQFHHEFDNTYYEIQTLEYRKKIPTALASYTFGALKSDDAYIKDLTNLVDLDNRIFNKYGDKAHSKNSYQTKGKIVDGLNKLEASGTLHDVIINEAIADINRHNIKDRVLLMTKYLIHEAQRYAFFSFMQFHPATYVTDNTNINTWAVSQALATGVKPPLSNPVADANPEAVEQYAISTLGKRESDYIFDESRKRLRNEVGSYFSNNRYTQPSLDMMRRLFSSHVNYTSFIASDSEYVSNGQAPILQTSDDVELVLSWRADSSTGSPHPFRGVGNVMSELYFEEGTEVREGHVIRQMLRANQINIPNSITNSQVADLFNFRLTPFHTKPIRQHHITIQFEPNIGRRLWVLGVSFSEIFNDPLNTAAALAFSRGENYDLPYFKAVLNLTERLSLNPDQRKWLEENRAPTMALNEFVNGALVNNQLPADAFEVANSIFNAASTNTTDLGKQLIDDILAALNTGSSLDFSPYLNSNAIPFQIGQTIECPNPPCNTSPNLDLMYAYGPGLIAQATDELYTALSRVFEYQNPNIVEGAAIKAILKNLRGINVPNNISNSELGDLFQIKMINGSFEVLYQQGIGADLIETGIGLLDIMAILAPNRGGGAFLAARGGGIVTKEVFKQYLATIAKGAWKTFNESMSDAAKSYQELISGRKWNESFQLNNVKFDALKNGVLGDAKSGMKNFVDSATGRFKPFFANSTTGGKALIEQAKRQTIAAEGNPIEWHFEFEEVRKATELLFEGIEGIKIILLHTPR